MELYPVWREEGFPVSCLSRLNPATVSENTALSCVPYISHLKKYVKFFCVQEQGTCLPAYPAEMLEFFVQDVPAGKK